MVKGKKRDKREGWDRLGCLHWWQARGQGGPEGRGGEKRRFLSLHVAPGERKSRCSQRCHFVWGPPMKSHLIPWPSVRQLSLFHSRDSGSSWVPLTGRLFSFQGGADTRSSDKAASCLNTVPSSPVWCLKLAVTCRCNRRRLTSMYSFRLITLIVS